MEKGISETVRLLHWFKKSTNEIAKTLNISGEEVERQLAKSYGTPMLTDPTPTQIRNEAARIRESWSQEEREARHECATSLETKGNWERFRRRAALTADLIPR